MPPVRSLNMNIKVIKGVAALFCTVGAVAWSFQSGPKVSEAAKNATSVAAGSKVLVITAPESPDEYGIGTYQVEGIVTKGAKVKVVLDDKEIGTVTANTEDGQYDIDVEVSESGKHVLLAEYKDAKGKDVLKKLEFTASKNKFGESTTEEVPGTNEEEPVEAPDKHVPDKAVKTEEEPESTLLPDDVEVSEDDPNSDSNRVAAGVHDPKPKAKVAVKPPTNAKAPVASKGKFVISSHTNFNVVKSGVIQIGGKGQPGDKIMLLIDNKPSMRGTIKSNGRWQFPVKIAKPGFRKITAQDLKSREAKTIKLKIK